MFGNLFGTKKNLTDPTVFKHELVGLLRHGNVNGLLSLYKKHTEEFKATLGDAKVLSVCESNIQRFWNTNYSQGMAYSNNQIQVVSTLITIWNAECGSEQTLDAINNVYSQKYSNATLLSTILQYNPHKTEHRAWPALFERIVDMGRENKQHLLASQAALPPEQQLLYELIVRSGPHSNGERPFNTHSIEVILDHWGVTPKGWEDKYLSGVIHVKGTESYDQSLPILLNKPWVDLQQTYTNRENGTTKNNILHMLPQWTDKDARPIIAFLKEKGFVDHPNSVGQTGYQAVVKGARDMNTRSGIQSYFGSVQPIIYKEVDPAFHPMEILARANEDKPALAQQLRLAMRAGTNNAALIHSKTIASYAVSTGDPMLLKAALVSGDSAFEYVYGSRQISVTSNLMVETLTQKTQPDATRNALIQVLVPYVTAPNVLPTTMSAILYAIERRPDLAWHTLPEAFLTPVLQTLEKEVPAQYEALMNSSQLPLFDEASQGSNTI